jgi:hypothetical protein
VAVSHAEGLEGCEESRIVEQCDAPNCQVTCSSDYQVCRDVVCTGSGCP